jgi:hypothetical protein
MAKILLIDQQKVTEIQMGQEITVGRAYSNLLRLEGEEVSRVHAIIYKRGADYILRDLDSKNGLLLNGQKVTNSLIAPGDDIQIGNYFIIFDPTESFDLSAFVRKKRIQMPVEPTIMRGMDADTGSALHNPELDESASASVSFRPSTPPPVASPVSKDLSDEVSLVNRVRSFFPMTEVENLLDRLMSSQDDPKFAFDALKLNTSLPRVMPKHIHPEDPGQDCQALLDSLVTLLAADRGVIVFQGPGTDQLHLGAIQPKDRDVSVNRVVLKACLRKQQAVMSNDPATDPEFAKTETIRKESIGSLIAYPLIKNGLSYGLIYADVLDRKDAFRREQLALLQLVGQMMSMVAKVDQPARRH